MAKNEEIDVITGDWMSEENMTLRGNDKRELNKKQLSSVGAAVRRSGVYQSQAE
jgi:hypothetical protein